MVSILLKFFIFIEAKLAKKARYVYKYSSQVGHANSASESFVLVYSYLSIVMLEVASVYP